MFFIFCFRSTAISDYLEKPEGERGSFLKIIFIPVIFYPLIMFLTNLDGINETVYIFLILGVIIFFIVFVTNAVVNLIFFIKTKPPKEKEIGENYNKLKSYKTWVIITTFLLPITGLMINIVVDNALGNFSHPVFFVIVAINTVVMYIPNSSKAKLNLLLFFGKSAGLTFLIYFTIVFMPYLPLGFVGLIIILGIYIFAPILATTTQIFALNKDLQYLKKYFKKKTIITTFILGLLFVPTLLSLSLVYSRKNYELARNYLYDTKAVSKTINKFALRNYFFMLENGSTRWGASSNNIPIISKLNAYFLNLYSYDKEEEEHIKFIFLNASSNNSINKLDLSNANNGVKISDYNVTTEYDENLKIYRAWLNLELKNTTDRNFAEYTSSFILPEGVFITDYYLDVFSNRKYGILSDKRAATKIYNEIVSKNRDPGILYYDSENMISFKVFLFNPNELRKTGIQLIYKKSFELEIDGEKIFFKGDSGFDDIETKNTLMVDNNRLKNLPNINLVPEYNFIIDNTLTASYYERNLKIGDYFKGEYQKNIKNFVKNNKIKEANVYLSGITPKKFNLENYAENIDFEDEGFNLPLTIREIYQNTSSEKFPIIIYVSPTEYPYIVNLYDYNFQQSDYYYRLFDNEMTAFSFKDNFSIDVKEPIVNEVVNYKNYLISKNEKEEVKVIIKDNYKEDSFKKTDNIFENALNLYADNIYYKKNYNYVPNKAVVNSFETRILMPYTSFIVLETEEQEKQLLEMQKNLKYDSKERRELISLYEPSLFAIFIPIIIVFMLRKKNHVN